MEVQAIPLTTLFEVTICFANVKNWKVHRGNGHIHANALWSLTNHVC